MNSSNSQPAIENRKSKIENWRVVAASVTGVSHEKANLPCQDAHAFRQLSNSVLICAVADGAGSAALSEIGSRIAVQVSVETLERRIQSASAAGANIESADLQAALRAVQQALETEAETRREPLREFATTLLLVVVYSDQIAALQVGDGAVVAQNAAKELVAITVPPDAEYANATTFVTSPDALESAQIVIQTLPLTGLAMFSDGLQRLALKLPEGTPHAPFFTPLFRFAHQMEDAQQGTQQLTAFLRSPRITERADDDLTLLLAVRH